MVGVRIKELRVERCITQEQLAQKLNIDRTTLAGYETGRRTPDLYCACRIADYFDVSIDYLLGRVHS